MWLSPIYTELHYRVDYWIHTESWRWEGGNPIMSIQTCILPPQISFNKRTFEQRTAAPSGKIHEGNFKSASETQFELLEFSKMLTGLVGRVVVLHQKGITVVPDLLAGARVITGDQRLEIAVEDALPHHDVDGGLAVSSWYCKGSLPHGMHWGEKKKAKEEEEVSRKSNGKKKKLLRRLLFMVSSAALCTLKQSIVTSNISNKKSKHLMQIFK